MTKEFLKVLMMLFLSFILSYCGGKSDINMSQIEPSFIWDQHQDYISTQSGRKHTWSGFSVKKNFFDSFLKKSKFIFWRKKPGKKQIFIDYLLKGKPVFLLVNGKRSGELQPTRGYMIFARKFKLKKGVNFIEFIRRKNSKLKIQNIKIGKKITVRSSDLCEGESFTVFLSPGTGFISLKGEGKLEVKRIEWRHGEKKLDLKNFVSSMVRIPLHFNSPGFIKVECFSGRYNVENFRFNKNPTRLFSPKILQYHKPSIFILLIDGCQQSHLGIYGYHRSTSPHIDEFAKDGVVFKNAYANATFTGSSVATLFTGLFPQHHQFMSLSHKLPERFYLLPEYLKKKGYQTSVYSEAGNVTYKFGFGQGVDDIRKMFRMTHNPKNRQKYLKNHIHYCFNKWTDKNGLLFSYVHYRAPHFPLLPPPPFLDMFKSDKPKIDRSQRLIRKISDLKKAGHKFNKREIQDIIDDYDSSICHVDSQLGDLIQILKRKGLYDDSLIIFTSDHGEALYEHGELGHGYNVFNETSQVPLVVKFPKCMNLKGYVDTVVQLADIFPTIADLFGEKMELDGQSLFKSIKQKIVNDNMAISTTFQGRQSFGIRWRDWYYLVNLTDNSQKLYNLKSNPLDDCSDKEPDLITFFRGKFLTWLNRCDRLGEGSQSIDLKKLPADIRDELKSLGYIN